MVDLTEHPALERLHRLEQRRPVAPTAPSGMGYQPTLDGVRAMSVIAVILYHAGFGWMHGGFFGVEVFFVVSGFLITSLLVEERDGAGRVHLGHFWIRRWRRLLPALFTMLLVIGTWAVFWGSNEQHTQVRRDYPWGILYLANWGQIFSAETYFSGTPTLFRHLWSLAVEEQWYLIWPLVFVVIARRKAADHFNGVVLATVACTVMVGTAIARAAEWPSRMPFVFARPSEWGMREVDTTNFLYLSTFTRSSGLLLGAALAFMWRPWRIRQRRRDDVSRKLDLVAFGAVVVLGVAFVVGRVEGSVTYYFLLPLVTVASAALVAVVVHPWADSSRVVFGWRPLVEVGKRSYGLYLWSWPIMRIVGAYHGGWSKFVLAMAITIPVSEACYRWVETPIRRGALGRWWGSRERHDWNTVTTCAAASIGVVALSLTAFFASAPAFYDAAKDTSTEQVAFESPVTASSSPATAATNPSADATDPTTVDTDAVETTPAETGPPVTAAVLPRRLVIVGDSTAHSLAINLPDGIGSTFAIADGSVDGCSVYDSGKAISSRNGFTRTFSECAGWEQDWVSAAGGSEVALVVLGAWDVFDVDIDGQRYAFGTAENDARFKAGVQRGIDALAGAGVKVALLEIPCMRPQDVEGAGVPALPERGDDARVAHLNQLLREVAAANPASTVFVAGPAEYCSDPSIASNLAYRWDGVHAYKPGAKLTYETIAQALLAIPVP